jgi:dCMP deaminase
MEAGKSSDWWRHVASAIVKDGKVLLVAHNHHIPSAQTPYIQGDPRSDFQKGVNLELSTAIHSEASLIAQAAEKGISLRGASVYVTTFPCPPCAKLIAYSGIKKVYYSSGYGVLDGESVLKVKGVEIIFVETK